MAFEVRPCTICPLGSRYSFFSFLISGCVTKEEAGEFYMGEYQKIDNHISSLFDHHVLLANQTHLLLFVTPRTMLTAFIQIIHN